MEFPTHGLPMLLNLVDSSGGLGLQRVWHWEGVELLACDRSDPHHSLFDINSFQLLIRCQLFDKFISHSFRRERPATCLWFRARIIR